eukprot:11096072-Lingulodinium_polyedra.AAC.1
MQRTLRVRQTAINRHAASRSIGVRVARSAHSMRPRPHGRRRMECANCELHSVAATERMSERISEQFFREDSSEMH